VAIRMARSAHKGRMRHVADTPHGVSFALIGGERARARSVVAAEGDARIFPRRVETRMIARMAEDCDFFFRRKKKFADTAP